MEELLTHEAKNAAEYYALGAIDLSQLLDCCLCLEEAKIAVDYAEAYYLEYEITIRRKYKRIDEIKESWETLHLQETMTWMKIGEAYGRDFLYPRPEEQFPCEERWLEDVEKGRKYTDEELQAAYDNWEHDRYNMMFSIGYKAAVKKVSDELIHKFFRDYHCDSSDMSYFYNGYFCKVYGLEDIMM